MAAIPTQPTKRRGTTTDRIGAIRRLLTTLIVTTIVLAPPVASQASVAAPILHKIHRARNLTWHYQRALGNCCRPYHRSADRSRSLAYRAWVLGFWQGRLAIAGSNWRRSGIRTALLCIHGGEGAWNAIDPSGTYFGGLQMNLSFMETYAPYTYAAKGTADHWTPLEQLTAGARAVRVRGYTPWPQTRIPCGV